VAAVASKEMIGITGAPYQSRAKPRAVVIGSLAGRSVQ
jgi:hypothetical protein